MIFTRCSQYSSFKICPAHYGVGSKKRQNVDIEAAMSRWKDYDIVMTLGLTD